MTRIKQIKTDSFHCLLSVFQNVGNPMRIQSVCPAASIFFVIAGVDELNHVERRGWVFFTNRTTLNRSQYKIRNSGFV
jgi:hypothetical protein